jgi:spore coat protein U-like protein
MKLRSVVLTCAALSTAQAMAFNCPSLTVTSVTAVYSPTVAGDNISTGSYSFTCIREAGDPATLNYSLAADNGLYQGGGSNRARRTPTNTAERYQYELYRSSPFATANRWQAQVTPSLRFTGTINFGAVGSSVTVGPLPFILRVPGPQAVDPAGTYSDTVAVTLRDGNTTFIASTNFSVAIITSNSCQISTPPGTVNFGYTSFQTTVSTATTDFDARCTTALPYDVTVSTPTGPVLGLAYTLSVSASGVLSTKSVTGTGLPQNHIIYGSMPADQSGTCATGTCTDTASQTITISY